MSHFRAVRPANHSPKIFAVDWGVLDGRTGEFASEQIYPQAFARKLASAMNWAYQEGRKDKR